MSMNPWTIPAIILAGGVIWWVWDRQSEDLTPLKKKDQAEKDFFDRPDVSSFSNPASRKWVKIEDVRAKRLIPLQPEYPGTAIAYWVQMPDNSLMKVHGTREELSKRLQLH